MEGSLSVALLYQIAIFQVYRFKVIEPFKIAALSAHLIICLSYRYPLSLSKDQFNTTILAFAAVKLWHKNWVTPVNLGIIGAVGYLNKHCRWLTVNSLI